MSPKRKFQTHMIISVTNLKGGVGKTTVTTNIAVGFALKGYDVCVVDSDLKQKSATEWRSNRGETNPQITVVSVSEKALIKEVESLDKKFDIVFVDGVPQISELAQDTILVSDIVVIPLTPSLYDYRGFETFYDEFNKIRRLKEKQGIPFRGFVLLNRVERNNIASDINEALADYEIEQLASRLFNRVAYKYTAPLGISVLEYTDAKAKDEMNELVNELEKHLKSFA